MAINVLNPNEILIFDTSPDLSDARRFLESSQFRLSGWRVGLVVHSNDVSGGTPPNPGGGRPGAVSLFGSHARDARGQKSGRGWGGASIRARVQQEGLRGALESLANERPGVNLNGVTGVEVHLWR